MPVILPPEHWSAWLARGNSDTSTLKTLLTQFPAAQMQAWPVSRAVSKGTAEGADLVLPLADS
jgi:putative SOS response-associated peptidase YedK